MTTITAPPTTPELALSVAALTVVSPHLSGAYAINLTDREVCIQGQRDEILHMVEALDLSCTGSYEHDGRLYDVFAGPAPIPFAAIALRVVGVAR